MKKSPLIFTMAFLVFLMLSSCGGDQTSGDNHETTENTGEATAPPQEDVLTMDLNTVNDIEDWVALVVVKLNEGVFTGSENKMIEREGMMLEAKVFNSDDNRIKIVRAGAPSWNDETMEYAVRYLMRDDQVVLLEEAVKGDDGFSINRIYYGNKKLLGASTYKVAKFSEGSSDIPSEYKPQAEDDFRLNYDEVMKRGNAFMKEVMQ